LLSLPFDPNAPLNLCQTFYLNLDLTSHHGPIRPPRKRQEDNTSSHEASGVMDETASTNASADAYTPLDSAETETPSSERIQILGLHTCNPIVSYHNQIFSCSWADQIGTELVFSRPETDPDTDAPTPLQQGLDFDLLAANSVNLLGRRANITSSSEPGLVQDRGFEPSSGVSAETVPTSQMAGSTSVPRRVVPETYQGQFIQRLQDVKVAKGETDTVRTVMSSRRTLNIADRLGAWARTEARVAEINELQRRALEGDTEAFETLEWLIHEHAQPVEEGQLPT
jgi:TFIIIC subunit triple barrel domain